MAYGLRGDLRLCVRLDGRGQPFDEPLESLLCG